MSFEEHNEKMCDRCEEKPKQWKVPYFYKDMNDVAHSNLGKGYRQYYICDGCKQKEERILIKQGKLDWNERWEIIKERSVNRETA